MKNEKGNYMTLPKEISQAIADIIATGGIAEVVLSGKGDIVVRELSKEIKIKFPKNG